MSNFSVVYDANVLYPSMLRDVLIRLASRKFSGALDRFDPR